MRNTLEEFGRLLVEVVRDRAVRECRMNLNPEGKTKIARRWQELGGVLGPAADILIPDAVDAALMELLYAIDQGIYNLSFSSERGDVLDLVKDGQGELVGWYCDWRQSFSKEPFFDDASDLELSDLPELPDLSDLDE